MSSPGYRWPAVLLSGLVFGLVLVLLYLKLGLAANMNLFGDEAFYWLESTRPAVSYSDLPPLTAWLIGLGTNLFGHSYMAVRSLFLLLGTALPLAIYFLAREYLDRHESMAAALLVLCLPLVAIQGLLAIPDVPMNLLAVLLLIAASRATRSRSTGWWLAFGVIAALGLATHFRMLVPLAAVAGYLFISDRRQLRSAGPWLAAGFALLGLLPTLVFNLQHDFSSLRFQFSDRHPWSFQSEGLLQPLQQAAVTTPLLYLLLIAAALLLVRQARRSGGHWVLLAWAGLFPPLFYFVAGLFSDQVRVSFHWPLPAYLALCVLLPGVLGNLLSWLCNRIPRWLAWSGTLLVPGLGALSGLGLLLYLFFVIDSSDFRTPSARAYPDNLVGWREAAMMVHQIRHEAATGQLLADNFMLAAQLSFELEGEPVFSLDHPLNSKHGRADQLAIWGLDENAWLAGTADNSLLVMEVSAVKAAVLPTWLHRSCELMGGWHLENQLLLHAGRKHFLFLRQDRSLDGRCDYPAISYLDQPSANAEISGEFSVRGWAFEDNEGVASVEIRIDEVVVGIAKYGLQRPGVQSFFPVSTDPHHPAVGFELTVDSSRFPDGRHALQIVTMTIDGGVHPAPAVFVAFRNE